MAQDLLAASYKHGWLGINESVFDAIRWYRKAACKGHPDSMFSLARLYAVRRGVIFVFYAGPALNVAPTWILATASFACSAKRTVTAAENVRRSQKKHWNRKDGHQEECMEVLTLLRKG